MPSIKRGINYLINNPNQFADSFINNFLTFLPDRLYLSLRYRFHMGKWIEWDNPKSFNEKLQWLKVYNRKSEYTTMVDKFSVKEFVSSIIGKDYIIPTLGVWNNFDEIDFDSLPDKFVLKTTHGGGGGGVVICKDKVKFDLDIARRKINSSLEGDIYKLLKEWPYKNVPKRIIAEKYIGDDNAELKDYKFFCFNGIPKFLKVDFGRFVEHHANYYDTDWNLLPFGENDCPPVSSHLEVKPENFDKMLEIAARLSKGHPFLRVDLYNQNGKIFFGELTFFPASGFGKFTPIDWDYKLGEMIKL